MQWQVFTRRRCQHKRILSDASRCPPDATVQVKVTISGPENNVNMEHTFEVGKQSFKMHPREGFHACDYPCSQGSSAKPVEDYEEVPAESGSPGPLVNPEMKFYQKVKAHLLKVALTVAATLLIVQYWRRVAVESHRFEPLFFIDSSRSSKMPPENVTVFDGPEEFNSTSSHNASGTVTPMGQDSLLKTGNETSLCPPVPPNLNGPIDIITTVQPFEEVESLFQDVEPGGVYKPKDCKARYAVALVIPYRDRPFQLSIFLSNIHRLLMKQQIEYEIFVIEQEGSESFNRGKLMNVGFAEASKVKAFDCFIFHDVDLIPEDDRNLYTCPEQPRHMSVAIDKFHYKLPYKEIFGGVCALSKEHFQLINGFSNLFWGWGGEDDDMYNRLRRKGLHVSRYPPTIARYKMLRHNKQTPNPKRFEIIQKGKKLHDKDGLGNLDYERKAIEFKRLYTWILVDLHPPRRWLDDITRLWKG